MGLDIFIWRLKKNTYRSSDDVAEDIKDYWRKQNYEDNSKEEIEKACPFIDEDKGVDFAEANLPTCSGFFFGSTEYDDYYFGDVSDVLDKLTALNEEITYEDQLVIDFDY